MMKLELFLYFLCTTMVCYSRAAGTGLNLIFLFTQPSASLSSHQSTSLGCEMWIKFMCTILNSALPEVSTPPSSCQRKRRPLPFVDRTAVSPLPTLFLFASFLP